MTAVWYFAVNQICRQILLEQLFLGELANQNKNLKRVTSHVMLFWIDYVLFLWLSIFSHIVAVLSAITCDFDKNLICAVLKDKLTKKTS